MFFTEWLILMYKSEGRNYQIETSHQKEIGLLSIDVALNFIG